MISHATTAAQEYEAFRITVAKLALVDGVSHEQAAANIAGRVLLGKLRAVGIKLADPEDENEVPSDEHQPIPADDWADFQPRDWRNGIIRVRVGDQFRKLALWWDIHIAIAAPAKPPTMRSGRATQDAIADAEAYLIELRRSAAQKPGGNKSGLRNHVMAQFGLKAREAEKVITRAREAAPNHEWDAGVKAAKSPP